MKATGIPHDASTHMRAQGDKLVRTPQKLKWWQLRGNQIALTKMLRYAKNLAGGEINPELILVKKSDGKVTRNQAKNAEQNQSNRTAGAKMGKALNCTHAQASKIEQIKAANEQGISMKHQMKAIASWKSFYRELCVPCETKRRAIVALTGFITKSKEDTNDPRVKFKPDGWQIKVLDALNEHRSVFVVAPTSSGKTFIAYYAMEKILRADNDGVLVYIGANESLGESDCGGTSDPL
ncbi:hypothetical protein BGX38DRAFT_1280624 [Terfezia claveryi]|nr:hypothetical protein BGX38DRAFT_1280624 [Terfezia claveryi]